MDDTKLYLGIDYGGNAIKMGLVDAYGQISGQSSIPTKNLEKAVDCRAFALELAEFVHGMGVYSSELGGIGLALPGIVKNGIYLTPNVSADWPCVLDSLSKTFPKLPIKVLNDANAAALGELWQGAGARLDSVLLVTIGSGLGSGLVVDGNVSSGGHGAAGEIGHMTVVLQGRSCKCGREGCLERYASARGLVQTFNEAGESDSFNKELFSSYVPAHETDAISVYKAAQAKDPRALYAFSDVADKQRFALAQAACVIDPGIILIGGGLSQALEFYLDDLRKSYKQYAFASCVDTPIQCASLKGNAGIYGAARYAMGAQVYDRAFRDWLDPDFGL